MRPQFQVPIFRLIRRLNAGVCRILSGRKSRCRGRVSAVPFRIVSIGVNCGKLGAYSMTASHPSTLDHCANVRVDRVHPRRQSSRRIGRQIGRRWASTRQLCRLLEWPRATRAGPTAAAARRASGQRAQRLTAASGALGSVESVCG